MSTTTIMDLYQSTKNDDGFNSDEGIETLSSSPTSNTSIISSTSDHGSLENVIDDEDDDDENCHNLNDDGEYELNNQHNNDDDDDEDNENYDNENDDDYDDDEEEEDEVAVNVAGSKRLAVLSFEQVSKLNDVMNDTVSIHGRGNFPTLEVRLKDLVALVRKKLELDVQFGGAGMLVQDIRLNGGAASHVLSCENQSYNDLDLIFAVEFSSNRHFDRVKSAVLNVLLDLLPEGVSRRRMMPCSLKEAYVGKMVKVNNSNDCDKWSLISLGNSPGHKNVELKFVDTMRRQFEFSVDSFQIQLDSLLLFYECAALPISENFYPTVVGESVYGDFEEALYHLENKLIATRNPEEIRGGGLLKYCNLLVRNYKPVDSERIKTLERYMCSRFFIDFPDLGTQNIKLEAYLRNHFWETDEENLQYQYLMHLKQVVENSTVCLMGHERRQTLSSIQSLAMQILCREHQKQRIQHQDKLRRHTIVIQQQHQQQQHQQQQQQQQHQQQQQQSQQLHMQQQSQSHPQQTTEQQQQQPQQQHLIQIATPEQLQQLQTVTVTTTTATSTDQQQQQPTTTTIQIASCPPSFLYANGIYYASVIPTTICTCPATWLSAT